MPASPLASVGTAGTIILVEDYDALSIAFGSALRRLAPDCQTAVVRSLAEAELAAASSSPDLFVLDFDPPHPGAVGFFNRMRSAHPDARALIIAANTWEDLESERLRQGAFRFIQKPFELAKFTEAVAGLLALGNESGAARDGLRHLDLTDLIALFCVAGQTTILTVTATTGGTGEIHFSGGQITQAVVMGKSGVEALEEMLRWRSPRFFENEMREHSPRTLHGPWTSTLQEALRAVRTAKSEPLPEPSRVAPANEKLPKTTILVVDDTDLLLVFVDEILRAAHPSIDIITAMTGFEGVSRATEIVPDLILLDYSLPDVTGDEVCRRLLDEPRTAQIPVIMMSGHIAEMAATAKRFRNVVATIEKPFLSAALVELVEQTLTNPPTIPAHSSPPAAPTSARSGRKVKKTPVVSAAPDPEPEVQVAPPPAPPKAPVKKVSPPAITSHVPTLPKAKQRARHNGSHSTPVATPSPTSEPAAPPAVVPPEEEPVAAPEPAQNVIEAPPEIPPPSPAPAPQIESAASPEPEETWPSPESLQSEPAAEQFVTDIDSTAAARIPEAKNNAVVLVLPLEITSIQLSPMLQTKAIRAKPYSNTVSMQIFSDGSLAAGMQATAFELDQVTLDARGQIQTVRLAPTNQPVVAPEPARALIVADVAALPEEGDAAMQVTPSAAMPMRIQLLALFELVAVEIAPDLTVGHLILRTRGAKVRLNLRPGAADTGITFQTAQVLLDRSARIAEVLLDAID